MHLPILKKYGTIFFLSLFPFAFTACGGGTEEGEVTEETGVEEVGISAEEALANPMEVKGVGPIHELTLEAAINQELATEGEAIFSQYCTPCHKIEERYIGPAIGDVTTRRSPEWIMNMILNPEQMVKEDPIAKQLLAEYMSPMADQNLTEEQARAILEYFRTLSETNNGEAES
ncbi:c-type cytochrome [Nafulsella turpanensis]|uniref:c-type cytochrome n=1 Tax=Nafulsella turpanensis TaxID=1265690 RepID=UPI000345BB0E|nr:cytochrome c [Nafulsella turpanensis]